MGLIDREVRQVATGLVNNARNAFTNVTNVFEGAVGNVTSAAMGLITYDVVGMNEAEIPNMKVAIRDYVTLLNDHMGQVKTAADTSNAFKGVYAAEVTNFVNAVCECIEVVISQLLAFNDKLTEVYAAYVEKDAALAQSMSSQSDELRQASGQKYEEKSN